MLQGEVLNDLAIEERTKEEEFEDNCYLMGRMALEALRNMSSDEVMSNFTYEEILEEGKHFVVEEDKPIEITEVKSEEIKEEVNKEALDKRINRIL